MTLTPEQKLLLALIDDVLGTGYTPLILFEVRNGFEKREVHRSRPALLDFWTAISEGIRLAIDADDNPEEITIRILRPTRENRP